MSVNVRPAAVAGTFYPQSAAILAREINEMLCLSEKTEPTQPKAIIVPHAGYIYSGVVAAKAYASLSAWRSVIQRVVLLGPTHRVPVNGLALPACIAFSTPLGTVPIDMEAITAIKDLPQIVVSNLAHAQEHSLEVQIPFLQTVLGEFSLLPLALGDTTPSMVAEVLERLWGEQETLIVVSSDLSHYLPYSEAKGIDGKTTHQIMALEATIHHQQACGATPVNGLLLAARHHGLRVQLLDQRNSGDTAGDKARVVGYAAFAFYEDEKHGR